MTTITIKNMKLLENMMLSNNIIVEAPIPCIFPDGWNKERSDLFRAWFRKNYPIQAEKFKIDATGNFMFPGLCTAYHYEYTPGNAAGDQWVKLSGEHGGGAEEPWKILYLTPGEWVTLLAVVAGLAFAGFATYKIIKMKINAIKWSWAQGIELFKRNPEQYKLMLQALRNEEGALERIALKIEQSNKLTAAEKEELLTLLRNRSARIAAIDQIQTTAIEAFERGELTAAQVIKNFPELPPKHQQMLRDIENNRRRGGIRPRPTPKNQTAFQKIMQKFRAAKLAVMQQIPGKKIYYAAKNNIATFMGDNFSKTEIENAVKKAYKGYFGKGEPSLKQKIAMEKSIKDATDKLEKSLSGSGHKMLDIHAQDYARDGFIPFKDWKADKISAGQKNTNVEDYIMDRAMHDLVHNSI